MVLGGETVLKTLAILQENTVTTTKQQEIFDARTAHKLNKENCKIDWSKNGREIFNLIRGLSPYPAAWSVLKDGEKEWNIKIFEASCIESVHKYAIGKVITTKNEIKIAVKDGFIELIVIQFPGKKKMSSLELLNGMTFSKDIHAC